MNVRHLLPIWFLIILMLSLSTSCKEKKLEPELVPITTTGENTMGFYVDGVPVNITGEYGGLCACGVNGGITIDTIIHLHGSGGNPRFSLVMYIPYDSLNASNEFILNSSNHFFDSAEVIDNAPLGGNIYTTDSIHSGKITFLRLENGIASGTFYFDAIHPESGKVIHVTEGRFDINLK